jgi:hypothetical protein
VTVVLEGYILPFSGKKDHFYSQDFVTEKATIKKEF